MRIGKNKWGGYCPPSMSWNSGRLRKGLCTEWQHHLYNSWYTHGKLIHGTTKTTSNNRCYIGIYFHPDFYSFEKFYNFISKDPLFPQFVANHNIYDIDKDDLYSEWSPRSVKIVTATYNQSLAAAKTARPIKVIDPDGYITIYPSSRFAASVLGIQPSTISQRCISTQHCVTCGKWLGWSFEFI